MQRGILVHPSRALHIYAKSNLAAVSRTRSQSYHQLEHRLMHLNLALILLVAVTAVVALPESEPELVVEPRRCGTTISPSEIVAAEAAFAAALAQSSQPSYSN